jgi:hypothetical protein
MSVYCYKVTIIVSNIYNLIPTKVIFSLFLQKSCEGVNNRAEPESNRAEVKSNRAKVKSNRAEPVSFCAIRFFLLAKIIFLLATKTSVFAMISS